MKRLALFTCAEFPSLLPEEQYLLEVLPQRGVEAVPLVWNAPLTDLTHFDALLVRSIWGYFTDMEGYEAFLRQLAGSERPVFNPVAWLKWNCHKFYLRDLAQKGVPIVPTRFFPDGVAPEDAREAGAEWQTSQLVLKPAISAGSYRTELLCGQPLPASGAWLLQPFLEEIRTEGEWSFVFFDGRFSHAQRKTPAAGDFRVQKQFGGTYFPVTPAPDLLRQAQFVLDVLPAHPFIARVDGVIHEGRFLLMGLELIEPDLYLYAEKDRARYVEAICTALREC